ncbi:enoyl-[acyl-carrier-protein] reductase (NADH) [Paraburkholderia bryophila]|uniref:Enoyl-[acyl-carrier-protein] reductase (NADH) n=1 Tax=Paraburkholderia bryophila TaxID=420952 RepID=A0A7Y9W5P8_9BURK|nr:enoyl-[acyl-carrier-protein] reductase (NADH) [Paraburkholderia bryophila]
MEPVNAALESSARYLATYLAGRRISVRMKYHALPRR